MVDLFSTRCEDSEKCRNPVLDQIERYNNINGVNKELESDPMGQVTNVNQLRDVSPTEWAYEGGERGKKGKLIREKFDFVGECNTKILHKYY